MCDPEQFAIFTQEIFIFIISVFAIAGYHVRLAKTRVTFSYHEYSAKAGAGALAPIGQQSLSATHGNSRVAGQRSAW